MKAGAVKLLLLLAMTFVLGGGTLVTLYATGQQVVESGEHIYMVSHTEYRYDEPGQIVTRLVNFQDQAITVDNCTVDILYPDKSFFVEDALMFETGNITGDHYYTFTTPSGPEGVYEYQATCIYQSGAKTKTATNSFHLSSAFSNVFTNLTAISSDISNFRAEVAANFTAVLDAISGAQNYTDILDQINLTVSTISSDLTSFVSDTQTRLTEINTTTQATQGYVLEMQTTVNNINTSVNTMLLNLSDIMVKLTNVEVNVSATLEAVNAMQTTVNTINSSVVVITEKIDAINTTVVGISSDVTDFRAEVAANFTEVIGLINGISVPDYSTILNEINATTHSTYDYMTGTLATNVNDVLSILGVINATANRIEANTLSINSTVNEIKQNQEDEVYMTTYSG